MSHYAEYKRGMIDEDEFRLACNKEFAGEEEEKESPYKLMKNASPRAAMMMYKSMRNKYERS